jgi:hypothetical protein
MSPRRPAPCIRSPLPFALIALVALVALVALLVLGAASSALASPTGPPDGFAGNPPANITCRDCHGYAVGDGSIELLGVPLHFTPGESYELTVKLQDPGQRRWGFEITSIDAPSHAAGTFTVIDSIKTQLSDHPGSDPDYLKQTLEGTQNGILNGPVTWDFRWRAPPDPVPVTFYLAGNAANGNNTNTGDYIYSIAVPVDATTAAPNPNASPAVALWVGPSYPEPFTTQTAIPYALPEAARVTARIVDAAGRIVVLLAASDQLPGRHLLAWDGRNAAGRPVAPGAYRLVIDAAGHRASETLLRIRP